jgi:hypothetical protein
MSEAHRKFIFSINPRMLSIESSQKENVSFTRETSGKLQYFLRNSILDLIIVKGERNSQEMAFITR